MGPVSWGTPYLCFSIDSNLVIRPLPNRMMCKDTVEEKIMQLQDRKHTLANDLISTKTGFLKKLSLKDIVGLFS